MNENNSIEHSGVKGMKWGIRKSVNEGIQRRQEGHANAARSEINRLTAEHKAQIKALKEEAKSWDSAAKETANRLHAMGPRPVPGPTHPAVVHGKNFARSVLLGAAPGQPVNRAHVAMSYTAAALFTAYALTR